MPDLSPSSDFTSRYSRQILFPGIGEPGQALLAEARVAIVGVGATGAATASLLARAGVGHLTLIDRDFVEPSNLQRQVLFDEADARESLPKAEAARRKIAGLLLDCTDNFESRYLLNDFAVEQGKPWIYAAALGAYAASMTILPVLAEPPNDYRPTACLACLFPSPPSGAV